MSGIIYINSTNDEVVKITVKSDSASPTGSTYLLKSVFEAYTGQTVSGGSSSTASNGLTSFSNDIQLGGSLTKDTTIDAANTHSLNLGVSGGEELVGFNVDTTGYSQWGLGEDGSLSIFSYNTVDGGGGVQVLPYGLQLNGGLTGAASLLLTNNGFQAVGGYNEASLTGMAVPVKLLAQVGGDVTGIVLTPHATNPTVIVNTTASAFKGVQYAANHSANFTARSLVDKGFVTGYTINYVTGITAPIAASITPKADKLAPIINVGSSYSVSNLDSLRIIQVTGSTNSTITIPAGLTTGLQFIINNLMASNTVTLSLAVGTTNRLKGTVLATQYAGASIYVYNNAISGFGNLT